VTKEKWTQEQIAAFRKYMQAADRVGLGRRTKTPWVPFSDVLGSLKPDGARTPLYVPNTLWLEYKAAAEAWLAIEPQDKKDNRMSATRGDYGSEDSWEEPESKTPDTYSKIKE
jgi:hypothetical protein